MAHQADQTFDALLSNLCDETSPLKAALLYSLSDPTPTDLAAFQAIWPTVPVSRRRLLMSRLVDTSETSFDVDFKAVALFALDDEDSTVRATAIAALWEDRHPSLMHRLLGLVCEDPSPEVRCAAAGALGRFVLLGELGKLPQEVTSKAEDTLLYICSAANDTLDVQRRALESLAYSGRHEVTEHIENAFYHDDPTMRSSAIFAMGRSADERWAPLVLPQLDHQTAILRYEAVRAAGELALEDAIPQLIEMLDEDDREIRHAAIWALGEIGGGEARQALHRLAAQASDSNEHELQIIEDALGTLALSDGALGALFLSQSEDEDDW